VRHAIEELSETEFDVAVIGAGINGASTAEQLASIGYRVLVVDKSDFAV
jgi:glycerol-3-phosphate dehydrogenase